MKKEIKIIGSVEAVGTYWDNATVGSVHAITEPPKSFARNYPNTEDSVWIMGNGAKIRLRNTPDKKEFCYVA